MTGYDCFCRDVIGNVVNLQAVGAYFGKSGGCAIPLRFFAKPPPLADKVIVSRFLEDAERLFQTAAASDSTDLAIVVGARGEIRITDAAGWDLTALQIESGARSVYRVSRNAGAVRVEGRSGLRSCLIAAEPPAATARRLLGHGEQTLPQRGLLLEAPPTSRAKAVTIGADAGPDAVDAHRLARHYQFQIADAL